MLQSPAGGELSPAAAWSQRVRKVGGYIQLAFAAFWLIRGALTIGGGTGTALAGGRPRPGRRCPGLRHPGHRRDRPQAAAALSHRAPRPHPPRCRAVTVTVGCARATVKGGAGADVGTAARSNRHRRGSLARTSCWPYPAICGGWASRPSSATSSLPGDDLIVTARHSPPPGPLPVPLLLGTAVWPGSHTWVGAGGFYSLRVLETRPAVTFSSTDRIMTGWQDIKIGDRGHAHPAVALDVVALSRGDRRFSAVGLRWGPLRLPMTSPGRGRLRRAGRDLPAAPTCAIRLH